jgi:hypothetical protein
MNATAPTKLQVRPWGSITRSLPLEWGARWTRCLSEKTFLNCVEWVARQAREEIVAVPPPQAVTQLLGAWSDGDERGLEQLTLAEAELCRLPRGCIGLERMRHAPSKPHWPTRRFCSVHESAGGAC